MKKSPVALVKEKFGDKAGLVSALEKFGTEDLWLGRTSKDKGLAHVSNSKLLRLHEVFTTVKEKFGTRAKLIDGILELDKRAKDEGYKTRLAKFPVPRLFDMYKATEKRSKAKEPGAKKAAPKKTAAAAAKPAAKVAASKKPAAAKGGMTAKARSVAKKKSAAKKG